MTAQEAQAAFMEQYGLMKGVSGIVASQDTDGAEYVHVMLENETCPAHHALVDMKSYGGYPMIISYIGRIVAYE